MNRIKFIAVAAILSVATGVSAHPRLKTAGPAPASTVAVSPKALRIQFSEPIELAFSGVEVKNAKGEKQSLGDATISAKDKAQLIVPLKETLAPGKYTVAWHAVGDDTHHVNGTYTFTVGK
jgi:copper resistance protein C